MILVLGFSLLDQAGLLFPFPGRYGYGIRYWYRPGKDYPVPGTGNTLLPRGTADLT